MPIIIHSEEKQNSENLKKEEEFFNYSMNAFARIAVKINRICYA